MNVDLAWAAGFFDGEGCVGCYASGRSFYGEQKKYPKVSVSNTDKELLDRFREVTGLGKVYGPYIKGSNPNWSPKYCYRLDGVEAVQKLLEALRPYLGKVKLRAFEESLRASTPIGRGTGFKNRAVSVRTRGRLPEEINDMLR